MRRILQPTTLGFWSSRIAQEAGEEDASLESLSWTGSEYQSPGHLAVRNIVSNNYHRDNGPVEAGRDEVEGPTIPCSF